MPATTTGWVAQLTDAAVPGSKVYAVSRSFVSTTPLIANATLSDIISNLDVRRIVGTIYSDHAGSLAFQASVDGVNWLASDASPVTVSAATVTTFDQVLYAPLTKFIYTNGGTDQTTFTFALSGYKF